MKSSIKTTIASIVLVALLTGCEVTQRQNATTGETETNSATKGALIGALSGAVIGLAAGSDAKERKKYALGGLVGGGVIGGGAGYYLDRQEAALRKELTGSGVQVKRVSENELQLIMENGIGFGSGSSNLSSSIYSTLNGVATILEEYPDSNLIITGHTDSTGSDTTNQTLSEQRASSVGRYLINQKVDASRITTQGAGEKNPICTNSTSQGRECNRRVEISIQPTS